MKVLQIDSSILGDASISRQLTQALVSQLQQKHAQAIELEYLDLAAQPIPHLTAEILMGQNAEQTALGEDILQQYLQADIVVIGAAMYNFGLPSTLKPGLTGSVWRDVRLNIPNKALSVWLAIKKYILPAAVAEFMGSKVLPIFRKLF